VIFSKKNYIHFVRLLNIQADVLSHK